MKKALLELEKTGRFPVTMDKNGRPLDLQRWPPQAAGSLRAWDAADEYLLRRLTEDGIRDTIREVRIALGPRGEVRRIDIAQRDGDRTSIELGEIQRDVELPATLFR